LRAKSISTDLYPVPAKLKKQMKYANQINVPFTIIIGSDEMESETFSLKNMLTGDQVKCQFDELVNLLSE
jgi:histidyl-tRNA synthetase